MLQPNDFILPEGDNWIVVTIFFGETDIKDVFTVEYEQTTFHYGQISPWYNYELTMNEHLQELI